MIFKVFKLALAFLSLYGRLLGSLPQAHEGVITAKSASLLETEHIIGFVEKSGLSDCPPSREQVGSLST